MNKKSIPERLAEHVLLKHKGKYSMFIFYLLMFVLWVGIYIWARDDIPGINKYKPWFLALACVWFLKVLDEIVIIGFVRIINRLKKRGGNESNEG